jgi:hypothetical protein
MVVVASSSPSPLVFSAPSAGGDSLCARVLKSTCLCLKSDPRLRGVRADVRASQRVGFGQWPPMASACVMLARMVCRTCGASVLPSLRGLSSWVDMCVACSGCVGASGDAVTSYRCSCMLVGSASVCACVLNSTCRRFKSQDHSSTSLRGWPMLEGVRPSALANGLPMASACVTVACMVCRTCGHICASIVARVVVMGRCACGVFRSRGCKR